jgi:hypothetical protein
LNSENEIGTADIFCNIQDTMALVVDADNWINLTIGRNLAGLGGKTLEYL